MTDVLPVNLHAITSDDAHEIESKLECFVSGFGHQYLWGKVCCHNKMVGPSSGSCPSFNLFERQLCGSRHTSRNLGPPHLPGVREQPSSDW